MDDPVVFAVASAGGSGGPRGGRAVSAEDVPALSERQLRILRLRADGLSGPQVARAEGIALGTLAHHEEVLRTRLGARNMTQAVARGYEEGLLRKPRRRRRPLPERHGDRAGYQRHLRRRELACAACLAGNSAYEVGRRAARKAAREATVGVLRAVEGSGGPEGRGAAAGPSVRPLSGGLEAA